jgi:hypothetical protein
MLNAFCRVAPSVLRNFLAIFPAVVFFFAKLFNSRTSVAVHARRFFDFLAINPPFQERQLHLFNRSEGTQQIDWGFISSAVFDRKQHSRSGSMGDSQNC